MSKRRAAAKGKFYKGSAPVLATPARPNTVVVYGMKAGTTVVHRNRSSGRFTTPTSAQAIDETVTAFKVTLRELADK